MAKNKAKQNKRDYKLNCPICSKKYISVSVVNRHLRVVHNIKNYKKFEISSQQTTEAQPFEKLARSNKLFPYMVDTLKVKKNKTFGKHIVAECDIDVGKTVMVSTAYASVDYLSSNSESCFQCGRQAKKIQCEHCIDVIFCSKVCSRSRIHRQNCDERFNQNDCKTVRLVTTIIETASKSFPNVTSFLEFCANVLFKNKSHKDCKTPYSDYNEILQLTGKSEHSHLLMAKRIVTLLTVLPQFRLIDGAKTDRILFHLAYRHATTIAQNTFSEESALTNGGIVTRLSIYGILSRINHSCVPNVHHCLEMNSTIHCIVIRPIREGDQIYINYLGEMKFECDDDRKRYLKEVWGFDCNCEKCRFSFQIGDAMTNKWDNTYSYIKKNYNQTQSKQLKEECVKFLNKNASSWSSSVEFVANCAKNIINHT